MREHSVNSLDNFIMGWYLEDTELSDKLIEYHSMSETHEGVTVGGVKKEVKDSTDCNLRDVDLLNRYYVNLQLCVDEYIKKYKWSDSYSPWKPIQDIQLQHYKPNGGFYAWHTERVNATQPITSRHLVFMTYLNDVTDEGETEFFHQKLKVKPEKGLTLMWPADWTFTHRGIPSKTQDKYVLTGWFNFV